MRPLRTWTALAASVVTATVAAAPALALVTADQGAGAGLARSIVGGDVLVRVESFAPASGSSTTSSDDPRDHETRAGIRMSESGGEGMVGYFVAVRSTRRGDQWNVQVAYEHERDNQTTVTEVAGTGIDCTDPVNSLACQVYDTVITIEPPTP